MEVRFYSGSSKPFGKNVKVNFLHIAYTYGEHEVEGYEEFDLTDMSIEGTPIFRGELKEDNHCLFEAGQEIARLVKETGCEVIILCDVEFFKELVKNSSQEELDAKMITTSYRGMLYYAAVGEDKCALLIAYDK